MKPLSEYYQDKKNKDGVQGHCKDCNKANSVKNQFKRKVKKYQPPPVPEVCDLCGKRPDRFNLDHCHEKDYFRGWLCATCNTGLGKLGDNISGLTRAIEYLKRAEERYRLKGVERSNDDGTTKEVAEGEGGAGESF